MNKYFYILLFTPIFCKAQIIDTYKGSHLVLIEQDTFVAFPSYNLVDYNVGFAKCDSVNLDLEYANKEIELKQSLIDTQQTQISTLKSIKSDNEVVIDTLIKENALKDVKIEKQKVKVKRNRSIAIVGFCVSLLNGILIAK